MQKTFENMWVVVDSNGYYHYRTLSKQKEKSIQYMEGETNTWVEFEACGFTCIKVNVTFDIVKP